MKVYIVKSECGEYEQRSEYVVSAYFNEQKAEENKISFNNNLVEKEKLYDQCCKCPLTNNNYLNSEYTQFDLSKLKKYCSQAEIDSEHMYYRCKNIHHEPQDEEAWIEEIDVIE